MRSTLAPAAAPRLPPSGPRMKSVRIDALPAYELRLFDADDADAQGYSARLARLLVLPPVVESMDRFAFDSGGVNADAADAFFTLCETNAAAVSLACTWRRWSSFLSHGADATAEVSGERLSDSGADEGRCGRIPMAGVLLGAALALVACFFCSSFAIQISTIFFFKLKCQF